MAIGTPVAQGNHSGTLSSGNITTLATINNGDMIILADGYSLNASGITVVTDPIPNTYVFSAGNTGTTQPAHSFALSCNVTGFASGSTLAVTYASSTARATQALSVSGMWANAATVFSCLGAVAGGTTQTSATVTTPPMAQSANLAIASLYTGAVDPGAISWGAFTAVGGTTTSRFIKTAYLITSSAAPLTVPISWVNAPVSWRFSVQMFRGAAANSGGITDMMTQVGS